MTTATASVADEPRTDNAVRGHNNAGQCTPVPQPALGTQRITRGNGTSVGTVISLSCPDRHRPVGEVQCVWGSNSSTRWSGDAPWCEPLPQVENVGLHVAVLASVVSAVIILLMSMAFITCCLLNCVRKEERRRQEKREASLWKQPAENRSSCYYHKGRNNNNNNTNTQEKDIPLWDNHDASLGDRRACRCHQQNRCPPPSGPSSSSDPAARLALLPSAGGGYDPPGPPLTGGPLWGQARPPRPGQESAVSVLSRPFLEESHGTDGQPLYALCEVTTRK